MKDHFKLSTNFTSLFTNKQSNSIGLAHEKIIEPNSHDKQIKSASLSADKGNKKELFKLNPKLAHTLQDIPVDMLRKKSRSKLESLKDQGHAHDKDKQKWNIFSQKVQINGKQIDRNKDVKKFVPKKYHLEDIQADGRKKQQQQIKITESQLPYNIVRPSRLENVNMIDNKNQQPACSLFQTPLLPCFASQFRQSIGMHMEGSNSLSNLPQYKQLQQNQGVWKIGKIKINNKNKTAKLVIGGIQFEAVRADVAGRAGVVNEDQDKYIQINNWKYIWVVQPCQSLYT